MSLFDQLSGVLGNLAGGNLNEQEAHAHYDQLAGAVPQQTLGGAIGPVLSQLGTSEVQQRVTTSANQMSPDQKGGIVQQLLGALGGSSGNIGSVLGQLGIDQGVANNPQSATAEDVGKLAAHAKENDPSIFQKAMSVYAEHPTLVKALGTVVLAQIANHVMNNRN